MINFFLGLLVRKGWTHFVPPPSLRSMHRLALSFSRARAMSTRTNQLSFSHNSPDLTQVPQPVPQTNLTSLSALQLSSRLPPAPPILPTTIHSSLLGRFYHSARYTDFLCPPSGSILVEIGSYLWASTRSYFGLWQGRI